MNMEDLRDCISELIWDPTIDYLDKVERLSLLMNCAYGLGYEQGKDDTKEVILKAIYENI